MRFEFPLILDGAMGTELIKRGYTGEISSEEWSLLHPEAIRDIQSSYIDAGSRVIYTPTFGANRVKMEKYGLRDSVADFNLRLAALSREVAGDGVFAARHNQVAQRLVRIRRTDPQGRPSGRSAAHQHQGHAPRVSATRCT